MGKRARREKEKESMRNEILQAAIKIIAKEGYEKLSMRKIADAIEYTATTIYSYYKDKAEIIDDIARQIYEKIISDAKAVLGNNDEISEDKKVGTVFKVLLYSMADCAEMGSAVIRSGTRAVFGPDSENIPPEDNGILILNDLLVQGQQKLIFRQLDENISWMLVTALVGFALDAIENKLHLNEEWPNLVEIYVDMLVRGILLNKGELL